MRGFRSSTFLVLGLVLGLAAGAIGPSVADSVIGAPVLPVQSPFSAASFSALAEAVKPAVININAERRGEGRTASEEFYGEEFFRRFFGQAPERMPRRSLGSGVIIDPSGVALTNAHVVANATQIEVVLLDGSKHRATVVGADRTTDLAVLRLESSNGQRFPHLPLGDSSEVQVGDWVIAVGSPFGLQATVTSGIVSAKARQLGAGPYDDYLQTDAAINPGNSGGPLVNMRGEVIGINTAIVRGGSGIGFAIPAGMARRISTELLATGKVTRGWLGVSLQPLTPDLAASFGVKDGKGALVAEVVPDSPAARAGLAGGDVITEINGQKVDGPGDLARAVGLASPGEAATLKVWRDRREHTVEVKLHEAPGERQAGLFGLQVRPVTPKVAAELGLRSAEGVVVVAVDPAGPAAEAGLRRGDVIVEVNRHPVKTLADFERLTREADTKARLAMRVQRGESSLYVALAPSSSAQN